jgi:N-acetylglucosamine-6-sulfatase
MEMFTDAKAPRNPNWNPADEFQHKKGSWLRTLPLMNDSTMEFADFTYQSRAQALQGVDEIIEDVVRMLEAKGIIDNTYSKLTRSFKECKRRIGVVASQPVLPAYIDRWLT